MQFKSIFFLIFSLPVDEHGSVNDREDELVHRPSQLIAARFDEGCQQHGVPHEAVVRPV